MNTIFERCMVRKGYLYDLDEIVHIELAHFKERAFSRTKFRHYIKKGYLFVLATSDAVIGYCVVFTRLKSRTARINVVAVAPGHTGKGYGTALLDTVEAIYLGYGFHYMTLEVDVWNVGAIKLYKERGYQAIKRLPDYYGPGTIGIKMQKRLIAK